MKRALTILVIACIAIVGCKQKKSAAEKAAEEAQLQYEQTIIESARERIIRANAELEAAGMMPIDTASTFEMFRMLHGKDLEETIRMTLETVGR